MSLLYSPPLFLPKTLTLNPNSRLKTPRYPSRTFFARFPNPFNDDQSRKSSIPDEWGEKSGSNSEPELISRVTRFTAPDPPNRDVDDEWGPDRVSRPSVGDVIDGSVKDVLDESGINDAIDKSGIKDAVEKSGIEDAVDKSGIKDVVGSSIGDAVDKSGIGEVVDKSGIRDVVDESGIEDVVDRSGIRDVNRTVIRDVVDGSGIGGVVSEEKRRMKNLELKRCLIDSVYGSELGFRASSELRAEVSELISQLEAGNPTSNPTEVPGLLEGNWVLVYTAFSELLPLLAVGSTPLLKVQKISQSINIGSSTVDNSTVLSSPFATFSFSATADFEVRSPSRLQVRFKEATFKPPEIKSRFDLPENLEVFGQKVTLSPVQNILNPVQDAAGSISGALYGLPSLKIPIPGERTASWLLVTYLDEDFRISRGDGGIFVLIKEGSPLLAL